ncbi:MAG: GAF domain-containing protein [Pseudomonadota bacterium]
MYDRIIRIQRTKFYIAETIVGLLILVGINIFLLPGKPAFEGINPNPLWIIVLAMAARYGRNGAIFGSIATSMVFLAHYIFTGGVDAIYDDLWLLRYPFLFILVGFIIGEVRTVFILREDYLTTRVEELQNLNDKLTKEIDIVKEAHKDLTVNVATKQDTITILNEITARLKSYEPDVVYEGILTSLQENLGAEECSFYVKEGNTLKMVYNRGWKEYYRQRESFAVGHGLVGIAAELRHAVTVKDLVLKKHVMEKIQPDMLGDSVMAIPVVGLEEMVFGVASVERIPLLKLTESTIQTATIVCEIAASSLNNAYAFRNMEAKQIRDAKYDIYKYHYFVTRIKEEFLRTCSYMIPLSAIAFKWPKLGNLDDEEKSALIQSIITLLKARMRAFDVLAKGPDIRAPLVMLLSTTSAPQAEDMKQKIIEHMRKYKLVSAVTDDPIENSIIVASYNPHTMSDAQDMIKAMGL